MKYIKTIFFLVIGLGFIFLALSNRQVVTVNLMPESFSSILGLSGTISLPLFIVIFGGIIIGLLIGFVWEWIREFKQRRRLSKKTKELRDLERVVKKLKAKTGEGKDEVLAIIE